MEAELDDIIGASWRIYDDPNASDGKYIMKDPDAPEYAGTPIDPDGTASYTFTVEGGRIHRVLDAKDCD